MEKLLTTLWTRSAITATERRNNNIDNLTHFMSEGERAEAICRQIENVIASWWGDVLLVASAQRLQITQSMRKENLDSEFHSN